MAAARHPLSDHGGGNLLLRVPGGRCPSIPPLGAAGEIIVGNVFAPQLGGIPARFDGALESAPPVTLTEVAAFRIGVGEKAPRRHIPAVIAGDLLQGLIPAQSRHPGLFSLPIDEGVDPLFQPGDINDGLSPRVRPTRGRYPRGRRARGGSGQPAEAEQREEHWDKDCFFSHGDLGEVVF